MWNKSKNFPINLSYNKSININILNKNMNTQNTEEVIISETSNTIIKI